MALAKYLEDITERFFDGLAVMDRLGSTFIPGTYEPAPVPPTSWIRLNLKNAPLPDRIALLSGDSPTFEVETDDAEAPFTAGFVSGPNVELPEVILSDQSLSFHLLKEGLYRLQLTCGSYRQTYEIDVTETLDLDRQEAIQNGYLALQDCPNEWTRDRLDYLKKEMGPAKRPPGIPSTFCNGILDYHLALYHSEKGKTETANARFLDAYRNLRPYIAHSDVARFVCDYIHYLMNRFEGCSGSQTTGNFGGLRSFLSSPFEDHLSEQTPPHQANKYVEVLVLSIDQKLVELATLIRFGRFVELPVALDSLENHYLTTTPDPCCRARILVLLARGHRQLGNTQRARNFYQSLIQSNASSIWHQEARNYQSR